MDRNVVRVGDRNNWAVVVWQSEVGKLIGGSRLV
jgi:hypothetical protein